MKIGLITDQNPNDIRSWSGIPYSIYKRLQKNNKVVALAIDEFYLLKIVRFFMRIIFRRNWYWSPFYSKFIGRILSCKTRNKNFDILLCLGSGTNISFLKTSIPIILYKDSVFCDMLNYYPNSPQGKNLKNGQIFTQKALDNSNAVIFATKWPVRSAENVYGVPKNKIHIVHFGAVIKNDIANVSRNLKNEVINLLLIGVDWERKGCDVAVQCVSILNQRHKEKKYHLHIVGCLPPKNESYPNVTLHGFINKNTKDGGEQIYNIFNNSHIFILPTRAKCAGIVFAEASAYGLPSVAYNTGGVSDMILDEQNGFLLPIEAKPIDFANKVEMLATGRKLYERMSKRCVELYKNDLNWDISVGKIEKICISSLKETKR